MKKNRILVTTSCLLLFATADAHASSCPIPSGSLGTVTPDIFTGAVSTFGSGTSYAAGTYRITYIEGGLDYNTGAGLRWYINYHANDGYRISHSGGTIENGPGNTGVAYANIDALEAANHCATVTITHTGGTIGMYLDDWQLFDNGHGTVDPTFALELISLSPAASTNTGQAYIFYGQPRGWRTSTITY